MFFMQFLATDYGYQIMKQNRLSIHSSTGDLYYGGVNTNESLFNYCFNVYYCFAKKIEQKKELEKSCITAVHLNNI